MLIVAALAGLDGETLRARYIAGLIDISALHGQRQVSRERAA